MKINLLKASLFALSMVWTIACTGAMEKREKTENPFLFELTHKMNPECKGYLLGTNHHLPLDIFSEPVIGLIDSAKTIFVEKVHEGFNPNFFEELGAVANSPTLTWGGKLTSEELKKLKNIFSSAEKIDPTFEAINLTFRHLKPWAVYGLLDLASAISHSKKIKGMDDTFAHKGWKLIGLETLKDVVLATGLPKISDREAIGEIKKMLKAKSNEDNNEEIDTLYLSGSLEDLEADEWKANKDSKFINMQSTYTRNTTMIKNLFSHLLDAKGKPAPMLIAVECPFIVPVGVAHLVGKGGFLNNTSLNETFTIKRISNSGLAEGFTYIPKK